MKMKVRNNKLNFNTLFSKILFQIIIIDIIFHFKHTRFTIMKTLNSMFQLKHWDIILNSGSTSDLMRQDTLNL